MATTINFKRILDRPRWRPEPPAFAATGAGMCMTYDMRNNDNNDPANYLLRSATALDIYDPVHGDWLPLSSPALTGTFGAGATCIYHPSQGPRGTIAAGATTTSVVLSTALPAAVGVNQLADRGDGLGFTIRIIQNTAGGAGTVEERRIVANSSGTTPTIYFASPLGAAPAVGATYELLSGRVFMLSAGATAAGMWKYYDRATNSYSGNLSITNLPATIAVDSSAVAMSENHVPWNRQAGEGFISGAGTYDGAKNCIVATASSANTITGADMFANLQTNEYRNAQVRIVEDTTTPTAVGQRKRIASHTSGATGVFTVAAWAVTPSATAKFVVENDDDKIILTTSAAAFTYNYNITANTWDTSTWAVPATNGAGVYLEQSFGITRDVGTQARHMNLFRFRGGATNSIDVLDMAGAATGVWSNAIVYGNQNQTFTTGTSYAYDPITLEGEYIHINVNGTNRMCRFDMKSRTMEAGAYVENLQGVAVLGNKMAASFFVDGSTKACQLYQLLNTSTQQISLTVQA